MYDIHSMIVLQYDPLVQEVFDQARKLRCTWYDYYEKSVTFRPFQVNMLNAVTANFLGDNLQCWMQIQSGKGPWSSEVSGIVKIGQTMTMVSEYNLEQLRLRISLDNKISTGRYSYLDYVLLFRFLGSKTRIKNLT